MPEKNTLSSQDHRWNLTLNSIHEMCWGFGVAFHSSYAVIPLFLAQLGAPDIIIGSVAGVFAISAAMLQLPSAFYGGKIRNLKLAVMSVHALALPPIFLAGFIFAFMVPSGPSAWVFYYLCYLLFTLSIGIILPIWADFLETIHIPEKRGTFFGISFAFNSVAGLAGGFAVKRLLASSIPFPRNFGYGFLIYSGCILLATLIFLPYRMKKRTKTTESKTFSLFLSEVRTIFEQDHNFRRYVFSRILLAANYPAISLYAVYSQSKLGFDTSEAGVFTAITVLIAGLSSFGAGKIGDKFGHKRALELVFVAHLGALVTALTARTLLQTYFIFVFLGMGQGGFFTAVMSLIFEFAGDKDKKIYYALTDTLTAPSVLLFIILAGILSPLYGIPTVLMGIGGFLVAGILSLTFLTKEPRITRGELVPPESLM